MLSKKIMGAYLLCTVSYALANNGIELLPNQSSHNNMIDFHQTVQDVRENQVIYQKLDTSCGGAALSMLLENSMNISTTEKEVIDFVSKKRDFDAVNFQDMREFAQSKGVDGIAQYATFKKMEEYTKRNIPFIVRIHAVAGNKTISQEDKYQFHFVVVKGIANNLVSISDPMPITGGNIQYSKAEFLKMIKLKDGKAEIFFTIPQQDSHQQLNQEYTTEPERYPFENRVPRFMRF